MKHPGELLSAHLDGELTERERREIDAHLSGCGRCVRELEEMQRVRSAVRSLPILDLPSDLIPQTDDAPIPLRSQRGLWVGVAAAIVAVVVAVAALVTPDPATIPIDELTSRFGARASLDPAFSPAKVVPPPLEVTE